MEQLNGILNGQPFRNGMHPSSSKLHYIALYIWELLVFGITNITASSGVFVVVRCSYDRSR